MENQNNLSGYRSQAEPVSRAEKFISEMQGLKINELITIQKKLNYLCLELDPFNKLDLSIEEKNILNEFELNDSLTNPFEFTNLVLQLLDIVENQIKAKQQ